MITAIYNKYLTFSGEEASVAMDRAASLRSDEDMQIYIKLVLAASISPFMFQRELNEFRSITKFIYFILISLLVLFILLLVFYKIDG